MGTHWSNVSTDEVQIASPDGKSWLRMKWDEERGMFKVTSSYSMQIEPDVSNTIRLRIEEPGV
jgi:hypothetical protein